MQLLTEIRVTVQLGDVSVCVRQTNRRVGHDRIEVIHQIVLRHHRQMSQVSCVKRCQVEVPESIAVPGRSLHRGPYERMELRRSLGVEPLGSPCHPLEMLAKLGQQMFDVTLARRLIGLHSMAPYSGAPTARPEQRERKLIEHFGSRELVPIEPARAEAHVGPP